jgi:hypothetical protein
MIGEHKAIITISKTNTMINTLLTRFLRNLQQKNLGLQITIHLSKLIRVRIATLKSLLTFSTMKKILQPICPKYQFPKEKYVVTIGVIVRTHISAIASDRM